jgi:hypothetical protein
MADDSIYIDELVAIAEELSSVAAEAKSDSIKPAVDALTAAAEDVGKAWSRSNIGYHARVYYKDYAAPPTQRGLLHGQVTLLVTRPDWPVWS